MKKMVGNKKKTCRLTFLAAALKASRCGISGLALLIRWISSLFIFSKPKKMKKSKLYIINVYALNFIIWK